MNEMIKVNCENVDCPTVSGRELHKALEVGHLITNGRQECVSTDLLKMWIMR